MSIALPEDAESEHTEDDHDSLFGGSSVEEVPTVTIPLAPRQPPPIPGLAVFPGLLPEREACKWSLINAHTQLIDSFWPLSTTMEGIVRKQHVCWWDSQPGHVVSFTQAT
jgi:hypothetical protein